MEQPGGQQFEYISIKYETFMGMPLSKTVLWRNETRNFSLGLRSLIKFRVIRMQKKFVKNFTARWNDWTVLCQGSSWKRYLLNSAHSLVSSPHAKKHETCVALCSFSVFVSDELTASKQHWILVSSFSYYSFSSLPAILHTATVNIHLSNSLRLKG
jgi:hypothetical protein